VTVFEDKAGAEESNGKARAWVQQNLANLMPNPPQVTGMDGRFSVVQ
jgi:hypothetical protein